jgi:hypothetical protein
VSHEAAVKALDLMPIQRWVSGGILGVNGISETTVSAQSHSMVSQLALLKRLLMQGTLSVNSAPHSVLFRTVKLPS